MSIHTIYPGHRVPGFFTKLNIKFISDKVTEILGREYKQKIIVPDSSIMREMQYQHEFMVESVAKLNQRVIMSLLRSFRNYQDEINKANYFAGNVWNAYNYDNSLGIRQFSKPKLNDNARGFRFHFTF